mgnify:CR=1 FL=1
MCLVRDLRQSIKPGLQLLRLHQLLREDLSVRDQQVLKELRKAGIIDDKNAG